MSAHKEILEALSKVLRTKFDVFEEAEITGSSSLVYNPDAFFIAPDGTLFIVEVKTKGITIDHIRSIIASCLDLQTVLGRDIEVIVCSPVPLDNLTKDYAQKVSSFPSFPIHFVKLTSAEAAYINSLQENSQLKQESQKILGSVLRRG